MLGITTPTIRPMTGAIGAAIEGVDLRNVNEATFKIIRQAFLDHCVVVFPGQHLDPESQIAFGRRFGNLVHTEGSVEHNVPNAHAALKSHPEILRVCNTGKGINSTENWHSDNCHVPRPTAISILAAQVLPEVGGDTIFSNQYVAYETLSEGYKHMLRGLRLKHTGAKQVAHRDKPAEQAPFQFHPVVRTHGETGRRALFIGGRPNGARPHFEGMTEQESQPIQKFLVEHSIQPDRCYRHHWEDGDVLMWDNRCTLHFAVHDYGDATRDLNRVTTEGEVPFEAPYTD
jgi:taurine dioxygenase